MMLNKNFLGETGYKKKNNPWWEYGYNLSGSAQHPCGGIKRAEVTQIH